MAQFETLKKPLYSFQFYTQSSRHRHSCCPHVMAFPESKHTLFPSACWIARTSSVFFILPGLMSNCFAIVLISSIFIDSTLLSMQNCSIFSINCSALFVIYQWLHSFFQKKAGIEACFKCNVASLIINYTVIPAIFCNASRYFAPVFSRISAGSGGAGADFPQSRVSR